MAWYYPDGAAERTGGRRHYWQAGARVVRPCSDRAAWLALPAMLCAPTGSALLLEVPLLLAGQERPPGHNLLVSVALSALAGAACLSVTVWCFLVMWRWARLDHTRQAAASGDRTRGHLAAAQPAAELAATQEPIIVGVRMRWPALITMWCIVCLLTAYLGLTALAGSVSLPPALVVLVSFGSFSGGIPSVGPPGWCASVLAVAGCVRGAQIIGARQQIGATASGLMFSMGSTRIIPWEDARLFAMYSSNARTAPDWYEVSSAQTVLHWCRLRPGTIRTLLFEPPVPYDEYHRRMEALLATVAVRTGLPLYDVR